MFNIFSAGSRLTSDRKQSLKAMESTSADISIIPTIFMEPEEKSDLAEHRDSIVDTTGKRYSREEHFPPLQQQSPEFLSPQPRNSLAKTLSASEVSVILPGSRNFGRAGL